MHTIFIWGSFRDSHGFAFFLMLIALGYFILKTISTFYLSRYQARIAYDIAEYIAVTRFASYLGMPYTFYLQNNSGSLMRNFLIIPFEFSQRIVIPYIQLVNETLVLILLCAFLIVYQPLMILALVLLMMPVIYLYQTKLKNYLKDISIRKDKSGKMLFKLSSQSMALYREIILHQKANYFNTRFKEGAGELAGLNARLTSLNELSPKLTELIAVAGIAFIFMVSILFENSNAELVQFLVLFALAVSRLLPAANRILLQSSTIRASEYVFEYLYELVPFMNKQMSMSQRSGSLIFNQYIELRGLWFKHEGQSAPLFQDLQLRMNKGESIGLVGPSGSGKTTLINILLRLLTEQQGGIYVDGVKLTESNKADWYALIGYVPQNINIMDGTFVENIAFGISVDAVDLERVKKVASIARLQEVIESQPLQYETIVGEAGLKISGGQRQRVGIARALYHDAQILIFDEATSALDAETEAMITESLRDLSQNKITTIVVAHRVQTLKYCNAIYKLENGRLSEKLSYEDLLKMV